MSDSRQSQLQQASCSHARVLGIVPMAQLCILEREPSPVPDYTAEGAYFNSSDQQDASSHGANQPRMPTQLPARGQRPVLLDHLIKKTSYKYVIFAFFPVLKVTFVFTPSTRLNAPCFTPISLNLWTFQPLSIDLRFSGGLLPCVSCRG